MKYVNYILIALAAYIGFLYLSRPDMVITDEQFKSVVQESGYNVTNAKTSENIRGGGYSLLAKIPNRDIKIYYIHFVNPEDAHDFYSKFVNSKEDKHSVIKSGEIRFDKFSAERQSFSKDYTGYAAIFTKNAVIYSKTYIDDRKDLDAVFDKLFKKPGIAPEQLPPFLRIFFKKA